MSVSPRGGGAFDSKSPDLKSQLPKYVNQYVTSRNKSQIEIKEES